jgi:hypothetical protein
MKVILSKLRRVGCVAYLVNLMSSFKIFCASYDLGRFAAIAKLFYYRYFPFFNSLLIFFYGLIISTILNGGLTISFAQSKDLVLVVSGQLSDDKSTSPDLGDFDSIAVTDVHKRVDYWSEKVNILGY